MRIEYVALKNSIDVVGLHVGMCVIKTVSGGVSDKCYPCATS
jgi:hypothetical protein